jgi:catechol 2,3-dioxygenase-like lactoylglutathione lyase family enzyme
MQIRKVHHVAYRCIDAKQTVEWYVRHLGMDFILAIAENQVPSTKAPDPYMHVFLDAGGGNVLAFFELPASPPMDRDRNTPTWVQHLALEVGSVDELIDEGAAGGGGHRGHRTDRPHDLQVDLLLRSERPSTRTGGQHRHAADDDQPRCREVGHARGVVAHAARAAARGLDARRESRAVMTGLDETHAPALRSWVESAGAPTTDFPIQNLPFAVFRRRGSDESWRGGVAIGAQILDLAVIASIGLSDPVADDALNAAAGPSLNGFMALGRPAWRALRLALSRGLREGAPEQPRWREALVRSPTPSSDCPRRSGTTPTSTRRSTTRRTWAGCFDPTVRSCRTTAGCRSATTAAARRSACPGESIRRPQGQTLAPGAAEPALGPSRRIDYELELGLFIGTSNARGMPIAMADAESHMFGLCLLNDWSARDLQAWEYQPLGPFLAKNFGTTLSPWIVTMDALAPFRTRLRAGRPVNRRRWPISTRRRTRRRVPST